MTPDEILKTPLTENQSVMAIMNDTGDQKIIWDRTSTEEVESTREIFRKWKAKGYMAYKVTKGGERGEVIRDFDPEAQSIIFSPPMQGGR